MLLAGLHQAGAQGTAFTYQGQLQNNHSPANGKYDMSFSLYNTNGVAIFGPVTNTAVAVSNGLFTVSVDFGSGVFTGTNLWLDISVRANGGGAFTELLPREPLTPVPFALYAQTAGSAPVTASALGIQSGTFTCGWLSYVTVTLATPYPNTNYSVLLTADTQTSGTTSGISYVTLKSQTTTGFTAFASGGIEEPITCHYVTIPNP